MKKRLTMLAITLSVVLAVTATATTFAAGTRFDRLDWQRFDGQVYPYAAPAAALPGTGDGDALRDGLSTRGWIVLAVITAGVIGLAGAGTAVAVRRRLL